MRLIDADALHDALKAKQKWVVRCGDKHNEGYTYDQVHFAIDDSPSIDICFCRECKHWERLNYEAPKEGWCDDQMPYSDGRWVDADDFCSYGEREGE